MYLGNYTREEKMCPQGAAFLQYSLESVVSSERLSKSFDSLKKHTALSSGVETVEKLRFSDNLCSDCAEHESSESSHTETFSL